MRAKRHGVGWWFGGVGLLFGCDSEQADYAPVDGGQLYYEARGLGDTVVFIHGFTLDSRLFDDQVPAFEERYRVLRYDARGFGRSTPIQGSFSTSEDLNALLDELDVESAYLVGISMGGRYAIDFTLAHPERVKALVVGAPGLSGQPLPSIGAELAVAVAAAQAGDIAEAKRIWFGSRIFAPAREQPAVEARLQRMLSDYSGWHFVNGLAAGEVPLDPPAAQRLGEIGVPTLALIGERDVEDIRVVVDAIAAGVPGARSETLPVVGHFVNIEAPAEFNRLVFDFFEQAAARDPTLD